MKRFSLLAAVAAMALFASAATAADAEKPASQELKLNYSSGGIPICSTPPDQR